jgi:site-specific recombinase XerD
MENQKEGHKGLLEDPGVRRWHENVARGSQVTADVYLRRLGNFCGAHGLNPKQLASMDERRLENLLMDFVGRLEKQGKAGSYVGSVLKAIKSWLAHNHRKLEAKIKVKGANDTPSLREERIPSRHELTRIFFSGGGKARAASALMAHAGLRIETLGNYRGTDGLRVRDFPEMKIGQKDVEFERIPTMVVVRRELSKGGHQYFTFLSEEGCGYLKNYLEERIKGGEKLTPDSPIITPKRRTKPFVRTGNIGDAIRKAIRKAGLGWRPYVLRSYFDTQLMLAESKGHVIRDFRQFWMGHVGDIEARYTTNKGRLPREVIESMRGAYIKSQGFLQTTGLEESGEERLKEKFRREWLLVAGYKSEEVEKIDLSRMSDEEVRARAREKLLSMMENNGNRQRVIPAKDIEKYISQGWEYIAAIPGGKAIVRLPL